MFLKSVFLSTSLIVSALMMGGCTTATPHESLKNAMNKTFDTTGYNYTSTTRITKITFPEETNATSEEEKTASEKGRLLKNVLFHCKEDIRIPPRYMLMNKIAS